MVFSEASMETHPFFPVSQHFAAAFVFSGLDLSTGGTRQTPKISSLPKSVSKKVSFILQRPQSQSADSSKDQVGWEHLKLWKYLVLTFP